MWILEHSFNFFHSLPIKLSRPVLPFQVRLEFFFVYVYNRIWIYECFGSLSFFPKCEWIVRGFVALFQNCVYALYALLISFILIWVTDSVLYLYVFCGFAFFVLRFDTFCLYMLVLEWKVKRVYMGNTDSFDVSYFCFMII